MSALSLYETITEMAKNETLFVVLRLIITFFKIVRYIYIYIYMERERERERAVVYFANLYSISVNSGPELRRIAYFLPLWHRIS